MADIMSANPPSSARQLALDKLFPAHSNRGTNLYEADNYASRDSEWTPLGVPHHVSGR